MDKIKIFLLLSLVIMLIMPVYGQESCKELYQKAEAFYEKAKYDDARKCYQRVIDCGDGYLAGLSKTRLEFIKDVTTKPGKQFGLSRTKVRIPYQGGDAVVTVSGNGPWEISMNSEWCSTRKSGSQIIISSQENTALKERMTEIKVKSGNQYRIIEVFNDGAPEMLRSSVAHVMFPPDGETNVIDIFANTEWYIKDAPKWLFIRKEQDKILLTASVNNGNIVRNANVKLESPTNSIVTISVFQSAGQEKLSFSKNELTFGPDGGDEYIKVYTDADDWKFGDFPHWCQVTRIGQDSIKIHCTSNVPINEIREASVNVTTGLQTLGINVSQEAKPLVMQIPNFGIGGRAFSLGLNAGYVVPMIMASSGSNYTGSVVNYGMGNNAEEVAYSSSGGFTLGVFADIRIYKNIYLMAGLNYTHYGYNNEFSSNETRNILTSSSDNYIRGKINDRFTEKYTIDLMEIPILVSYRFPITKISHLQINLGPVLNYGLSAKMNITGYSDGEKLTVYKIEDGKFTDIVDRTMTAKPYHVKTIGEFDLYSKNVKSSQIYVESNSTFDNSQNFETSPLNRINWGGRIGVAYEYSGISVGVEYNLMLSNMANKRYWEGGRWPIFDFSSGNSMTNYKQRNHSFQIKLGYTFRY